MSNDYKRLRSSKDFASVFKKGKRHFSSGVLLFYIPNTFPHSRIGFIVSTKFASSAVMRNKQKRILRAATHSLSSIIPPGFDIIISYTNHGKMLPYKESVAVLEKLIKKIQ